MHAPRPAASVSASVTYRTAALQDIRVLIPGVRGSVTFHGKRVFANGMKVKGIGLGSLPLIT